MKDILVFTRSEMLSVMALTAGATILWVQGIIGVRSRRRILGWASGLASIGLLLAYVFTHNPIAGGG